MNTILNLKSFLKFQSRNKVYTAINIFGFSISLMFVILIMVYVTQGLSTDRFHKNADSIYLIGNENNLGFAWRIGERIAEKYPEIERICPLVKYTNYPALTGDTKLNADIMLVDSTFFTMFTFPLTQGDPQTVLATKDYAVISESFAKEVFSDRDPMGQFLQLNDTINVMINGIMPDIKNSTIPYADIIIKIDNVKFFNSSLDLEDGSNANGVHVFAQVVKGADIRSKEEEITTYMKDIFWIYKRGILQKVIFTPLKDIYFSETPAGYLNQNSWTFAAVFLFVGILILLFAIINYINLTVAQTGSRAKEMATRRLLGSSRGDLFLRLILESFCICAVSFLTGLLLAFAVLPAANDLLQTTIDLKGFFTPWNSMAIAGMIVLISLVSGLLPATVISNFKPVDIVKGSFRTKTKMVFSKIFITFQNVITIMLLAASLTMILQINHMIKAPLGYNTTHILNVYTGQFRSLDMLNAFVNEVSQLASVKRVGQSQGTPFDRGNNYTVEYEERNISFQILTGDSTFFDLLGFEVLRQNNVSGEQYYLNEQAVKELQLPADATEFKPFEGRDPFLIAGIVRDFQLSNISFTEKNPVIIQIKKTSKVYPWNVLVEIQGDPFTARDQIKDIYERISPLEFTGKYIDQQIEESYAEQQRMAKLIVVFAAIAILISLLGLLAMSTYFIRQRSREVAIRKVFGSSNSQILLKLVATFMLYVGIAFLVATPVIWWVMNKWIADYPYRISLSPWIFIAAGLFCFAVAFITVFFQSYRAATENPAESIKTE